MEVADNGRVSVRYARIATVAAMTDRARSLEPTPAREPTVVRGVFASWSIRIPASFEETFVADDGYWHAWDRSRSVSLTSLVMAERGRPVPARSLLRTVPRPGGDTVAAPDGLAGWAVEAAAVQPARASRVVTGTIAVDGRLLVATITADDPAWAIATWQSIRHRTLGRADRRKRTRTSR